MKELVILIGRSAAGKTTFINELKKDGYKVLQSVTNRERRDGEGDDEYQFVSPADSFPMTIVSFTVNDKWKYGITKESLLNNDKSCIAIISEGYAENLKNAAESLGIKVIVKYLNVPRSERIKRMLIRGDSEESISKRLEIEDKEGEYTFSLEDKNGN